MADIAELGLAIRSDGVVVAKDRLKDFENQSGRTERATEAMRRTVVRAAAAFGAFVGAALSIRQFVTNTIEAERVQTQLGAAIASTGGVAGQTIQSLNAHAAALQRVTTYGDEAINGAQGLLLTFTRIRGDVFPQATEATLNLATAMGTDLNSAALQVGEALNDPITGMTALTRSGITFSQAQKDMVKQLVETGDMLAAQNIILKELETQFGGSARAARDTLGGALTSLGNAWGDLFEITGPATDQLRESVERLIGSISDPRFVTNVQAIGVAMFGAMELGVQGVSLVVENLDRLLVIAGTFAAFMGAQYVVSLGLAAGATGTLTAALVGLRAILLRLGFTALIVAAGEMVYQFTRLVEATGGWGNALEALGKLAAGVWEGIWTSAQAILPALRAVWLEMQAQFILAIEGMKSAWNDFIAIFEQPALTVTIGGETHELIGGLDLSGWKYELGEASGAAARLAPATSYGKGTRHGLNWVRPGSFRRFCPTKPTLCKSSTLRHRVAIPLPRPGFPSRRRT